MTAVGCGIDRQAHIDDRNQIIVGQSIEQQATIVVVGAAEDNVARLECVTAQRIADPASQGDDAGADAELGNLAGDDLDLRAHGVRVGTTRAVKTI